jgi:hypothetical protein
MCFLVFPCYNSFRLQYIRSFARFRCDSEDDVLEDVSDLRNGILLYIGLHGPFGRGEMVFMKV